MAQKDSDTRSKEFDLLDAANDTFLLMEGLDLLSDFRSIRCLKTRQALADHIKRVADIQNSGAQGS